LLFHLLLYPSGSFHPSFFISIREFPSFLGCPSLRSSIKLAIQCQSINPFFASIKSIQNPWARRRRLRRTLLRQGFLGHQYQPEKSFLAFLMSSKRETLKGLVKPYKDKVKRQNLKAAVPHNWNGMTIRAYPYGTIVTALTLNTYVPTWNGCNE